MYNALRNKKKNKKRDYRIGLKPYKLYVCVCITTNLVDNGFGCFKNIYKSRLLKNVNLKFVLWKGLPVSSTKPLSTTFKLLSEPFSYIKN